MTNEKAKAEPFGYLAFLLQFAPGGRQYLPRSANMVDRPAGSFVDVSKPVDGSPGAIGAVPVLRDNPFEAVHACVRQKELSIGAGA